MRVGVDLTALENLCCDLPDEIAEELVARVTVWTASAKPWALRMT
jgi:hypothetical protein